MTRSKYSCRAWWQLPIGTSGLMRTFQLSPEYERTYRAGGRVMLVSAVLIALNSRSQVDAQGGTADPGDAVSLAG